MTASPTEPGAPPTSAAAHPSTTLAPPAVTERAIGRDTERVDADRKVRGAARYAAEFHPTGMVHAALVQATIPHGRVVAIDAWVALAADGVLEVLTHENAERLEPPAHSGMSGDWRAPLSDDMVHHAGQYVAAVIADTPERARAAARLVRVEYEVLEPILLDPRDHEAMAARAVVARGHETGSDHERGDFDGAWAAATCSADGDRAAAWIDERYATSSVTHNPMEPHATVAEWSGGRLTLHESTQGVQADIDALTAAFGLPADRVRVINPYVGGAFGCKGAMWPHAFIAAMAARAVGRPVRVVLTRPQMFSGVGYRPATSQRVRLAADSDGRLLALAHDAVNETATTTDWLESCCRSTSVTLYECEHVRTTQRVARSNINPPTFMRAPGETPGTFALESAMDELAVQLGTDPVELRVRNHADRHPGTGQPWSGKHLLECYRRGGELFGWRRRSAEPRSMRDARTGELVGWGMATSVFPGIRNQASARVRVHGDGRVEVASSGSDLGTGAYTVAAMTAADAFGVPVSGVDVELGDSSLPSAPTAGGSALTASMCEAVAAASRAAGATLLALAERSSDSPLAGLTPDEVDHVHGRIVALADPRRSESYAAILERAGQPCVEVVLDSQLATETSQTWAMQTHGAQFCEVRIDPLDPRVRVTRVVSVMDVGRVMNPRTARSQVLGSLVMGIGMALTEQSERDPRTGAVANANLADYAVPVNADIEADIHVEFVDVPDARIGTLGARGAGEVATTGIAAAIANAVFHATGTRVRHVPITPELLLA